MIHPLRSVTLHITQNCELRCSYCYAGEKNSSIMSSETARDLIRFIRRHNSGNPCRIIFFGGEPFLAFRRIVEITDEIARPEDQFRWSIASSGTVLTDEMISWIKKHDVQVQISIDGCREAHNKQRRYADGNGSFDTVWNSCQKLLSHEIPFTAGAVVTPGTSKYLVKSADDLFCGGIRQISFSHDTRPVWSSAQITASVKAFTDLTEWYFEKIIRGFDCSVSSIDGRVKRALAEAKGLKPHLCAMGMCEISVDCEGSIFPCVQFVSPNSDFLMGNVTAGIDLTRQKEITALNRSEPSGCITCELKNRCLHQCGCVNYKTTGALNQVSPAFCQFEKEFAPSIDRFAERLWEKDEPLFRRKYGI